jgi:hypothetical protein
LNIKAGKGQKPTFWSDTRITGSTENKVNHHMGTSLHGKYGKVRSTRVKERWSYKFTWMQLDLTKSIQKQAGGENEAPTFEVELEIVDIKYLL